MKSETAKPNRNLRETSFAFQHYFDNRNLRNLSPIGSGGEVSPHPLSRLRAHEALDSKARLPLGVQNFPRSTL
jgi:hypothetical protein